MRADLNHSEKLWLHNYRSDRSHCEGSISRQPKEIGMNRINRYLYEVVTGETVTMVFTPVDGVNPVMVAVSMDNQGLPANPPSPNPTYQFRVTKSAPLTHFCEVQCDFVGAPATSRFDVRLKGDQGPNEFGFSIKQSDFMHDPSIRFKVL